MAYAADCYAHLSLLHTVRLTMARRLRHGVEARHLAAYEGDAHAVAAWLDEGGDVDARCSEHADDTLLMAAAVGGQEAIVRMS